MYTTCIVCVENVNIILRFNDNHMLEQRKYDGHRKAQAAKKTWQNRENKKK